MGSQYNVFGNNQKDVTYINYELNKRSHEEFGLKREKMGEIGMDRRRVFIIHGQNEAKWRELQSVLLRLGVEAIELSEQQLNGKTIIEKFEYVANQCQFAIAVFTYDDVIRKGGQEYLQVRPNVIFELGWFYARLGREKVMIVEEKNEEGNIFSDLSGIYRYRFHENVSELYGEISDILKKAGIRP